MINQSLIQEQHQLEEEMRGDTVRRYHSLHEKASDRGEFSDTHAGKNLMRHVVEPFENAIRTWVAEVEAGKAGRKPTAVRMVRDFDDIATIAFLFTKSIVNVVPMMQTRRGTATRTSVVLSATQTIHDELRLRWFAESNHKLLKAMLKDFDKRDVNRERRRQLIQRTFNQRKLEWQAEGWDQTNRLHLGSKLLELFRDSTGLIRTDIIRTPNGKSRHIVEATEDLVKILGDRMEQCENLFTVYYPMVVKPRPWSPENMIGGGYITNNVTPYKMVKAAKMNYLNDLANVDMPEVYDSINAIQETGFRVNQTMVDAVEWAYQSDKGIDGLPTSNPAVVPEAPHNIDEDEAVKKEYLKRCYMVHDENRRAVSSRGAVLRTVMLARKFAKYDEIFFPHDMDSRGRIYPKPTYLNPQGTGYVKSMLEFSVGKPIETEGQVGWLAITGANAWGEDKCSLQDRANWVFDNEEMILSCADDFRKDLRWTEADSPFEFLRFCLEWKGLSEEGVGYVSHMPVPVDATCSGLQHFSAMLRDQEGGFAVNLTASPERQDIYGLVAEKTIVTVTADLDNNEKYNETDINISTLAKVALELGINRKVCKRPVMIVPYAGTFSACMKYVEDYYNELFEKGVACPMAERDFTSKFIPYIAKHIWSNIDLTVVAARNTMNWMKVIAKTACNNKDQAPLQWTTPTGFVVQQARYKQIETKVKTYLDGKQVKMSINSDTRELDPKANSTSLPPNYIHSMDAAHLQKSIAKSLGNDMSYAMVHDSFAVHAADMTTFWSDCIPAAFYEMYEGGDNLENFLAEISVNFPADAEIPAVPSKGTLDLTEVFESEFFFS